ncbi:PREDICTED: programmed cell death protein 5 isoform X3 [Tarenaya hassleriana]|uniref:programmed cell death protein 5 isoform X3 n=1 Tax=Tarenaya hassleriana TaxID=28532 RepID=UPI00053C2093|nr:PREDICTED: programmed cell death protein 5 isoform X3 [Tarenaya hassleriana]
MADPELEAIRQRRMQELMARHGTVRAISKTRNNRKHRMRLRVARIALVKPDKARGVEDVLLRAAQTGQIVEKVSEERLISLLEQINSQTTKRTKVTIQRRRGVDDD